ncbi:MAG: DNA repair protein RadA [Bacteroidales bacterium]
MSKSKTVFICQNCGYLSPKWIGRCPSCNSWNSFIEEIDPAQEKKALSKNISPGIPTPIKQIKNTEINRISLHFSELDRVLGGGLVSGSLVLLGGEPGIGKSTLILQAVLNLINQNVLYISGEESEHQIKMRADRIGIKNESCHIFTETSIERIIATIKETLPDIVIIDSVQTIYSQDLSSSPGTISQIRECARQLQEIAKTKNIPIILIGHINKDGEIAGPMSLEHIVDVVLQFEGDSNNYYRLLRPKKNRFGSTYEIGVFEMLSYGLSEITDPANILLSDRSSKLSGVAYGTIIEGSRTLMIEVQALVSNAVYGAPQRSATGFDPRRLQMLLAVIEKRLGLKLIQKDVFINIAGGLKIIDPAADLAVIAAVLSSYFDKPFPENSVFIGETGLSGQIRQVSFPEKRLNECIRLGFNKIFIPNIQNYNLNTKSYDLLTVTDINSFATKLYS